MHLYSMNILDVDFRENNILWRHSGTIEPMSLYISKDRQERALRYKFDEDRKRSLCVEYLLNHGLQEIGIGINTPVTVAYDTGNGKPYLPDYQDIYFNLSHSGDYAVCVLNDSPVGVDIEECKDYRENVAKRFFAPNEYEDICSLQDLHDQVQRFYQYWVLKESFMKATGLGMKLEMNSFRVCMGERITYQHQVNDRIYEAKLYHPADGYYMAVCIEN